MADTKVRVGIVGTSWWVDLMYAPSLLSHPAAEVVAICGRDRTRAEKIAARFGSPRIFQDYRLLLTDSGLDAVVIATPDDLHCEMVMAAIDAGLHVLCEKPLAGNHADARRMQERAQAAGIKHMVLFTWRWQPHWRYVKQLIDSGFIGKCRYAELRFLSGFALEPGYKWRFDARRANGVVGDLGSHMIDFARWYLGEPVAVRADLRTFVDQSATADPPPRPSNDAGFLTLEFAGNARADITVSAATLLGDEGVRISARFYGDEGSLEIEHPYFGRAGGPTIKGLRRGDTSFTTLPIPDILFSGGVDPRQPLDPYARQSAGPRRFIDAIIEDNAIETDFAVGARVQQVVDAALLSAADGRWVRLDAG